MNAILRLRKPATVTNPPAVPGLKAEDVCFSAAKLFFAYGLGNALTFPMAVGATVLLMAEPPSIDGRELTDKGYINQRVTIERRAALVERLYADPAATDVIRID